MDGVAENPRLTLLVADDDEGIRSLLAVLARYRIGAVDVLEAEDGAEAVRLGLQRRPQVALLDVSMPRLDGIGAARALRKLQPQLRLALQTADPHAHRERARELGVPLFDKGELDRAIGWVALQSRRSVREKLSLTCAVCGYGVARAAPPDRCPMCQSEAAWVHDRSRPLSRTHRLAS